MPQQGFVVTLEVAPALVTPVLLLCLYSEEELTSLLQALVTKGDVYGCHQLGIVLLGDPAISLILTSMERLSVTECRPAMGASILDASPEWRFVDVF